MTRSVWHVLWDRIQRRHEPVHITPYTVDDLHVEGALRAGEVLELVTPMDRCQLAGGVLRFWCSHTPEAQFVLDHHSRRWWISDVVAAVPPTTALLRDHRLAATRGGRRQLRALRVRLGPEVRR